MAQTGAKHISDLLNDPASMRDSSAVDNVVQQYPYFLPARYLQAAQQHKNDAFSDAMLSRMHCYMGNWLLFCDFVQAASTGMPLPALNRPAPVEEIKEQPAHQLVAEPEVITEAPEPLVEEQPVTPTPPLETGVAAQAENIGKHVAEAVTEQPVPTEIVDNVAHMDEVIEHAMEAADAPVPELDELISPVFTNDYFRQQGLKVDEEMPEIPRDWKSEKHDKDKSLMVMMSFAEWLLHFRNTAERQREESEDQKALKTMWQKEKLAAAIEEENDEIPEKVFEMAVNSITKEEDLASEPLAEIYIKQGKYDKAIDMYRKLSLRNPQKNAYFARKIEDILKEKQ